MYTLFTGDKEYCSPGCGKTVKGSKCTDECETRGYQYYWCHVGQNWDHCSRSSCPIKPIKGPSWESMYNDCSAEMVNKRAWFEYLYYPGKWLAKGYADKLAALWKPKNGVNGKELYCPAEGYGWYIHGGKDGSVYLETGRPGYGNDFLIGYGLYEKENLVIEDDGDVVYEEQDLVYNMANAVNIKDSKQYHETFAFRIMCQDCSTKQKCILWRLHDEYKLYSDSLGYLQMCKECGSHDWFNWRVHMPNNVNLTCSNGPGIFSSVLFLEQLSITFVLIVFYRYYNEGAVSQILH